jgi:tRNA (Thr-GGU) A37 N-methylase
VRHRPSKKMTMMVEVEAEVEVVVEVEEEVVEAVAGVERADVAEVSKVVYKSSSQRRWAWLLSKATKTWDSRRT